MLTVPSAAVITEGEETYVNLVGPDDQPVKTPFEAGKMGDDKTQVLSGLTEGQEVLLVPAPPEGEDEGE